MKTPTKLSMLTTIFLGILLPACSSSDEAAPGSGGSKGTGGMTSSGSGGSGGFLSVAAVRPAVVVRSAPAVTWRAPAAPVLERAEKRAARTPAAPVPPLRVVAAAAQWWSDWNGWRGRVCGRGWHAR